LRQSMGWTQDRLAQEAEISKSFLSEIENNKVSLSGENLLKIANVLNTSLDYLMKGNYVSSEKKPSKPIEIPRELSELAEDLSLSHKATLALLEAHNSLIARRSDKEKTEMTKDNWRDLFEKLKEYLK